jgi:hypothetical protein
LTYKYVYDLSPEKGAAEEIASSGILPILAQSLRVKSPLTNQVALVVAEMAREGEMRCQPTRQRNRGHEYQSEFNGENQAINHYYSDSHCV